MYQLPHRSLANNDSPVPALTRAANRASRAIECRRLEMERLLRLISRKVSSTEVEAGEKIIVLWSRGSGIIPSI